MSGTLCSVIEYGLYVYFFTSKGKQRRGREGVRKEPMGVMKGVSGGEVE